MRRANRHLSMAAVCVLAVMTLTACGARTVAIEDYPIASDAAATCKRLVTELPGEVTTQGRRVVEPTMTHIDKYSAAWGSPVIALRCGDPAPDGFIPDTGDIVVDGITWSPQQLTHGYRFYSKGLAVPVSLTVPSEYAPETDALTDIATALTPYLKP